MTGEWAAIVAGAAALATSGAVAGLVARIGPVDAPRARGLHRRPTPTSGGVGIMAGVAVGLLLFAWLSGPGASPMLGRIGGLLLLAAGVGVFGALDDMADFGARAKLAVDVLLAAVFAVFVGRIEALPLAPGVILPLGPIVGGLGTVLWIVTFSNAVNFMDGANGLAPGALIVVFAGLAVAAGLHGAPLIAVAAMIAAAAGLGFLPWNHPGGRLFQGDVGALFSGFFAAGLAVLAAGRNDDGPLSLYFVVLAGLPLLTDVLLTLLDRARARLSLFQAHRGHVYQRWLDRGGRTHGALAWRAWLVMAAFTLAALAMEAAPRGWRPVIFAAGVATAAAGWAALRRRLR
ncbi:hypothetical protein C5708_03420 [Caulobacter sp. CCUG 60055]|uniref:glycosyltransferase family 4 protein n=2 Tax=Bacteria TaxID=2 RepID=UPI001FA6EECE|nr:MraY family glycosyltransferase [Caulobacter sp. CCUG 60055]MBQ1540836.1 undecaprenyl/decaprenyl-phosphate alpha-N-acetylglucosaminyl 1-phosphate transferase [Caulobacteraceae bacterium]MCI3179295.1 hypothetical protein [Caulobacter sp. CCUG 60055]